ncbi:MAG: dehydrogenase, partial [Flavobacteriaceae bacterium]|nr:dehydrogenase [Flavobacteriaceae bacterium]
IEVYTKVSKIAKSLRKKPRPVLLEFKTFRMRGHEEASGTKYVPQELMDEWAAKDPLMNYQEFLKNEGILNEESEVQIKEAIIHEINQNLELASKEAVIQPNETYELNDVYKSFVYQDIKPDLNLEELRLIDAISQGLSQSMERHDDLVILGQDIAEYGGVFKITEGFTEKFGKERVRNTPICESSIVETAMGLSIKGRKSIMEMQFADFATSGFNPIVNYLAKSYYRWNQSADVVIRMPCGGGVAAGPFHSQTNEAWFTKTPGLKVAYPAFPYDAKGLLATAINDPNPVMFFEHKALYRSIRQEVPTNYYTMPFGKASLIKEGTDVTIISYGAGVHWAIETLENNQEISADLLDLRTLQPLDEEAIFNSVKKTGKAVILQEDSLFGGIASDISAMIMETCFEYLDAPVKRVASMETPIPFIDQLEEQYLAKRKFESALLELLAY